MAVLRASLAAGRESASLASAVCWYETSGKVKPCVRWPGV